MNYHRYALNLAYDGSKYHGWQAQTNAVTVQEKVRNALQTILRHKTCVHGAGRTDTGVHASFFVAHFDAIDEIEDENKFKRSLNGILGKDIAIYHVTKIDKGFHSRFDATSRTYKYFIHINKNPFVKQTSHKFCHDLNVDQMNKACEILLEYKNFKSFEKAHSDNKTSICDVRFAKWEVIENGIVFTITADRFLRNMVRSIVGTMLDVGQGKTSNEKFRKIVESKNRRKAGKSAEAAGLFLVDIQYPEPFNSAFEKGRELSKFNLF